VRDELVLPSSRLSCTQTEPGPGQNVRAPRSSEPSPPLDVAVLDAVMIAELWELAEGDDAFVREVFTAYFEQADEIVAAMRASLSANDTQSFRLGAHALGGSSVQAGVARVAWICHEVQSSEDDAPALLVTTLETLESELRRVEACVALEAWAPMPQS